MSIADKNPFRTALFKDHPRILHPGIFEVRTETILKRLIEGRRDLALERIQKVLREESEIDPTLLGAWRTAVESLDRARIEAYMREIAPHGAEARARAPEREALWAQQHAADANTEGGHLVEVLTSQRTVDANRYRVVGHEGNLLILRCEATGVNVPIHKTRVRRVGGTWGDAARKK